MPRFQNVYRRFGISHCGKVKDFGSGVGARFTIAGRLASFG
ncbi:hypothetical protein HMPREF0573_10078 [Mobiluncus curtisii ATCC 43063]|uniref:Uncharacterized protein n=1 Tax=Mobiluncus curtisii (strain ATCC 43063 / DSM 2711 / V125) TaxID=548479 RepID=D6ZI48_MOBCV|nr:hypothetical protein HMPREF0573_10078 [Mobiluncus curtisii ATCC 43063]